MLLIFYSSGFFKIPFRNFISYWLPWKDVQFWWKHILNHGFLKGFKKLWNANFKRVVHIVQDNIIYKTFKKRICCKNWIPIYSLGLFLLCQSRHSFYKSLRHLVYSKVLYCDVKWDLGWRIWQSHTRQHFELKSTYFFKALSV